VNKLIVVALLSGCSKDVECGAGTELVDGTCVAVAATGSAPVAVAVGSSVSGSSAGLGSGSAVEDPWDKPPKTETFPLLEKLESFRNQMCACKDRACADPIEDAKTKWVTSNASDLKKTPPVQQRALADVISAYEDCRIKHLAGAWLCATFKDEMRGIEKQVATLYATEPIDVGNDHVQASLSIRRTGKTDEAAIFISDGMFDCGECSIAVKFDDQKIRNVYANRSTNYKALFVGNSAQWVSSLRAAKTAIVELPFYRSGKRQFTFELSPPDCLK
jgi:hypothetical protein